jgi:hypothetical protein
MSEFCGELIGRCLMEALVAYFFSTRKRSLVTLTLIAGFLQVAGYVIVHRAIDYVNCPINTTEFLKLKEFGVERTTCSYKIIEIVWMFAQVVEVCCYFATFVCILTDVKVKISYTISRISWSLMSLALLLGFLVRFLKRETKKSSPHGDTVCAVIMFSISTGFVVLVELLRVWFDKHPEKDSTDEKTKVDEDKLPLLGPQAVEQPSNL